MQGDSEEQGRTNPTATTYISEARASGLQQSVDKINQAYDNLGTALSS